MYRCVYVYMCIYKYTIIHTYSTHTYIYMYMYVYSNYIYIYICYIYTYTYILHKCIYVRIDVYVYICIFMPHAWHMPGVSKLNTSHIFISQEIDLTSLQWKNHGWMWRWKSPRYWLPLFFWHYESLCDCLEVRLIWVDIHLTYHVT